MAIQSKLGRFDLTMIIVSLIIGIGIFKTPSIVASAAGTPLVFYSAWILGGIICICGAFTFAEIGSRLPAAGGYYRIFSYCYHPVFAFMFNWALIFTNAGAVVGVALVGAEYIQPVIVPAEWMHIFTPKIIGLIVVTGIYIINYLGIRMGARAQNILSGLKIAMILLLCLPLFGAKAAAVNTAALPHQSPTDALTALGVCLIAIFFTFGGYQNTMNLGADIKEPQKNIPLGIFGGISIVLFLYLMLNIAYCQVLGFDNMKDKPLIASELAGSFFGSAGYKITSITVFISVMGYINSAFIHNPRMLYAMSEDNILPPIFKKVNDKTQAQEFGLTFFFLIAVVTLFLSSAFDEIMHYTMFIDSGSLIFAGATIFIL
ncbi:MAG TPA: APC family permease, partial [Bacteroidia bacterium]|nr:APC family permease [Bacteroidia bacterium]